MSHTEELLERAEETQQYGLGLVGGHQHKNINTDQPHVGLGLKLLCVWHIFIIFGLIFYEEWHDYEGQLNKYC